MEHHRPHAAGDRRNLGIRRRDDRGHNRLVRTHPHRASRSERDGGRGRALILVADDDPAICALLGEFLQSLGYRVHTVASGREALDCARRLQPTLVITDLSMPEMDGEDLAEALQREPDTAHIPVVLMSAWRGQLDKVARRAAADAYLPKPFDLDTVERLVIALVGDDSGLPPI
jgi:CheY-like chemotaxis protein